MKRVQWKDAKVYVCVLQQNEENVDIGMDYMLQAAEAGDRSAMIYVAKAFDTGFNLGSRRYAGLSWVIWIVAL